MKAGMPAVAFPGGQHHNGDASSIPGAARQTHAGLEPRVDEDNVRQYAEREPYISDVPVSICGIPTIRTAPNLKSSDLTVMTDVNIQNIRQLCSPDPRVRRMVISATGGTWIGTPEALKANTLESLFFLPPGGTAVFEVADRELWALAGDATATPKCSIHKEYWTD